MAFGEAVDQPDGGHGAKERGESRSKFVGHEGDGGHCEPVAEDGFFKPRNPVEGGGEPVASAEHIHGNGSVEPFVEIGEAVSPESEIGKDAEDVPVRAEEFLH